MLQAAFNPNWYDKLLRFEPYSPQKLKELLKERGLTIEKAAEESGIPKSTFLKWASGHSRPNIDNLTSLGEYFGVFLYGDWSKKP